jgi:hypothetical protein
MCDPALSLEILAEASRNPSVARIISDCKDRIRNKVIEALELARDRGAIASDISLDSVYAVLGILFDGITVQRALDPNFDEDMIRSEVRRLISFLLRPAPNPATADGSVLPEN